MTAEKTFCNPSKNHTVYVFAVAGFPKQTVSSPTSRTTVLPVPMTTEEPIVQPGLITLPPPTRVWLPILTPPRRTVPGATCENAPTSQSWVRSAPSFTIQNSPTTVFPVTTARAEQYNQSQALGDCGVGQVAFKQSRGLRREVIKKFASHMLAFELGATTVLPFLLIAKTALNTLQECLWEQAEIVTKSSAWKIWWPGASLDRNPLSQSAQQKEEAGMVVAHTSQVLSQLQFMVTARQPLEPLRGRRSLDFATVRKHTPQTTPPRGLSCTATPLDAHNWFL